MPDLLFPLSSLCVVILLLIVLLKKLRQPYPVAYILAGFNHPPGPYIVRPAMQEKHHRRQPGHPLPPSSPLLVLTPTTPNTCSYRVAAYAMKSRTSLGADKTGMKM